MTKDEALKTALAYVQQSGFQVGINEVVTAIKEALAQPEQEPVAWMSDVGSVASAHEKKMGYVLESAFTIPLYTTPPQRIWVGLVFCIVRVVSEIESKGLKPIVEKIWYGPQKENNT